MPKISKATAPNTDDYGAVLDIHGELDGYAVGWVTFREDIDASPLLKGCQDDRCQCPHWGLVVSGRVTFRYADGEETFEAGDAYFTPPGHVPISHEPGTELLMFSPADQLRETEAVMARNMAAMQAS